MSNPVLKLQILARAELTLAQIHARRAASRSALFSVAMVFLLLGLGMLTLAGYHALVPTLGAAWSAFVVALVDLVIGGAVLLAARRAGPKESEEKLARELRDLAYAEISADIDEMKTELEQIASEVRRIRSGLGTMIGSASASLGPLVGLLTKMVKRN
jgi:hypothetical protein